jgi:hypothetical protein
MEFVGFPKIARLNRDVVVTEKIDGTNAQVYIVDAEGPEGAIVGERYPAAWQETADRQFLVTAGKRTAWIKPGRDDNHGFAAWVWEHADELASGLGTGRHFGEWWGSGINRGYGLQNGEKRFSLFNVKKWGTGTSCPSCCGVVPLLAAGPLNNAVDRGMQILREEGSQANPGFMKPEGVVVFHPKASTSFKVTLENDEVPKYETRFGAKARRRRRGADQYSDDELDRAPRRNLGNDVTVNRRCRRCDALLGPYDDDWVCLLRCSP